MSWKRAIQEYSNNMVALMSDITGATLKISLVFASIDFKQIKVRGKSHKNLLFVLH